jgi:O-antigen ligase
VFALGWVSGCVVELIGGAIEQLSFTNVESPQLARLISIWFHAFAILKSSFFWSYAFVANTAIFLLLRRDVDEKQLDEVWRESGVWSP